MIIQYKDYYISSGAKNKLYTLRQWVVKKVAEETYDSTIHIKTLCADKKKAIQKAKEYIKGTGLPLRLSDVELDDRKKPSDIDWTKFQTGKYQNQHYESVCESDPNYVVYMISNYDKSQSYAKTLDLCKSVPKINALIEQKKREQEENIKKNQEKIENHGHHGQDGYVVSLSLEVSDVVDIKNTYIITLKDSEGKKYVYFENYDSTVADLINLGFFNFYAEIKHGSYQGLKQTYLRIPRRKQSILLKNK